MVLLCAGLLLCCAPRLARAQDAESDNPTGQSGDYNGEITTGGSYDAYTHNAKRSITDLTVPGSNGTYPLAFTRTFNSTDFPTTSDTLCFGGGGNWRHSYMWLCTSYQASGTTATAFLVNYPNGASVVFRPSRSTAPAGENTNYWRGPIGTQDRLEVPNANLQASKTNTPSPVYLHLSDGGVVSFTYVNGNLDATAITDPYGAVTTLAYSSINQVSQVTEPGGRWLRLIYTPYQQKTQYPDANNSYYINWSLLTQVQAGSGSTVRQTVSYAYVTTGQDSIQAGSSGEAQEYNTVPYYVLDHVNYDMEPSASGGGNVQAKYTYTPGNTSPPILLTAHDPHYTGAMVDLAYNYSTVGNGWVGGEANYVSASSTVGPSVSSTSTSSTSRTETRGDKDASGNAITRTFSYTQTTTTSQNNGLRYDPGTHSWQSTNTSETNNAKAAQLMALTDWQGNKTALAYYGVGDGNGQGNLQNVTDPLGNVTSYGHEPITGKVCSVRLPDGRVRQWTYLSKDLSDPSGSPSVQPYYLYSTVDERNQTTYYHRYPNTGLVNIINYPDGSSETNKYTGFPLGSSNPTYYKIGYQLTKLGAQIYYNYGTNNASGSPDMLLSVTRYYQDANGSSYSETTNFQYDALDRLIQTTDPGGVITQFSYNARHQLTQTLHASSDNTHVDRTYDDLGNCTQVSDELGHVTQTVYDAYRRPIQVIVPVHAGGQDNRTTYFAYEPRGSNSAALASAASHTRAQWSVSWEASSKGTERVFSPNGWEFYHFRGIIATGSGAYGSVGVAAGAGGVSTAALYSPVGQMTSSTDAQGQTTTYAYNDPCERRTSATDPLGHVTSWAYYLPGDNTPYTGWLKSVTTPGPDLNTHPTVTTRYNAYDPMGRVTSTTDPWGHTFVSGYDAGGDLTSQSDGDQSNTQAPAPGAAPPAHNVGYGFDQLGRKAFVTNPRSGKQEPWPYNATGTVPTYPNYAGATCTYQYDGRNRLSRDDWNGNAASPTAYAYDAASRVTEVANWHADIKYPYDDSGAVLTEQQTHADANGTLTTRYTHDIDGNVTTVASPSGFAPSYAYDCQQRCTGAYAGSNYFGTYTYTGDWLTERAAQRRVHHLRPLRQRQQHRLRARHRRVAPAHRQPRQPLQHQPARLRLRPGRARQLD